MAYVPTERHLLRAKDLADARYSEPLTVADLAAAAGLSPAHFSRRFKAAFGESPHQYLLTRRLERAAALLRATDWSVATICFAVGAQSVGSFTVSFHRVFGLAPLAYRAVTLLATTSGSPRCWSSIPAGPEAGAWVGGLGLGLGVGAGNWLAPATGGGGRSLGGRDMDA